MSNAIQIEKFRLLREDSGVELAGRDRLLIALYPPTSAQRARARLDLIVMIDRKAQKNSDWLDVWRPAWNGVKSAANHLL